MLFTSRHRRGAYPLAESSVRWALILRIAASVAALILLYILAKTVLAYFGVGNDIRRLAVTLNVEGRGTVNVYLEGGELQRAQDGMKLYAGDRVTTGSSTHATLSFFDGSVARLDQQVDLTIEESALGTKRSELSLELRQGALWIATPTYSVSTGEILRVVATPVLTYTLPAETEAVLTPLSAVVYSAAGPGVKVAFASVDREPMTIGEGQRFQLPSATEIGADMYIYRSPLNPLDVRTTFVEESRVRHAAIARAASVPAPPHVGSGVTVGFLVIASPATNAVLNAGTVKVAGSYGDSVAKVRVNEYDAVLTPETKTFAQELALPAGDSEFEIRIAALNTAGEVLEESRRTVTRQIKPPAAPTITSPAKQGETYRTQKQEFVIRGGSPANAVGIMVNDYRLQLFAPSKGEFSYLASVRLGNLKDGSNTFAVVAIDAAGNKSEAATITILLEGGAEGVVAGASASASSKPATPAELPNNDPLKPGTLTVTGPTAGTAHTATGSEFLIEGLTPSDTASVWVNDYQLQLYAPGKTFWNYIASVALKTLKTGKNVYTIVTRNSDGKILDRLEYTVTYDP